MRRWFLVILGLALAAGLAACAGKAPQLATPTGERTAYAHPEMLAETGWLRDHLNGAAVRVVDLRSRQSYEAGHIPNAIWYDSAKLKDPEDKLHVIRDSLFAQYMGELGVGDTTTVVAYDDQGGLWATRLWWVLDYYGHDGGKVLNGGWQEWQKAGLPTTKEIPTVQKATFTAQANPNAVALADYVQKATSDPKVVILDARSLAEYQGSDVRAARGGHIPKAVNLEWTRALTTSEPRTWHSAEELRAMFEKAGVSPDKEVITYCQTGVRAAHALFTLRLLGYDHVRVYDGSWLEWGNDRSRPIEQ